MEANFQEDLMAETETMFHAVEKDGVVTAIWEMQGRKHLRTIDPRSEEGRRILGSHTVEEGAEHPHAEAAAQAAQQGESQQ
jgi:DNA-binding PadR family transcriptional regulator